MAVLINQLSYKRLSQIIFEWQAADRTSLLSLFIVMEILLHWLWCLLVWWRQDTLSTYIDFSLLYPVWLIVTVVGLIFFWLVGHLARIKNNNKRLLQWQIFLIALYTAYIAMIIVMMGYSSLVAGVTLIGSAMLGMMLLKRSYIWRMFLLHVSLIVLAVVAPYFGIDLPNLRQLVISYPLLNHSSHLTYNEMMAIENAVAASLFDQGFLGWTSIKEIQRSSAFFWRSTHMYLALPKAFFMVYAFQKLLLIVDASRKQILQHANQDELTTLNNRRHGLTQMQQTLSELAEDQDYSIILLDLDFFKDVNDNYGHQVGDQVLREVAFVLKQVLEPNSVSRYGGEEFLITLPNTQHDVAMAIAKSLCENISRNTVQVNNNVSFQVTASLGLYALTAHELASIKGEHILAQQGVPKLSKLQQFRSQGYDDYNPELLAANMQLPNDICQRLISIADKALYKAKDCGRNQVVSANDLLAANLIEEGVAKPLYEIQT